MRWRARGGVARTWLQQDRKPREGDHLGAEERVPSRQFTSVLELVQAVVADPAHLVAPHATVRPWPRSSEGQSSGFLNRVPQVRFLPGPPPSIEFLAAEIADAPSS